MSSGVSFMTVWRSEASGEQFEPPRTRASERDWTCSFTAACAHSPHVCPHSNHHEVPSPTSESVSPEHYLLLGLFLTRPIQLSAWRGGVHLCAYRTDWSTTVVRVPKLWRSCTRRYRIVSTLSTHRTDLWKRVAPRTQIPVTAKRYGKTVYGIFGLITLSISTPRSTLSFSNLSSLICIAEYIIVITGREQRGELLGHPIYRASEFDILPLDPTVSVSSPPHPVEAHLLALVRSHLNSGVFLFSYGYDITRRLQAQWVAQEQDQGRAFWESVRPILFMYEYIFMFCANIIQADDRFFWNK